MSSDVLSWSGAQPHFGICANDHEQVIKVVGNAAGENTQRLHFVRTVGFIFNVMLLCDDSACPRETRRLGLRIPDCGHRKVQFNYASVFAAQPSRAPKSSFFERLFAYRLP